MAKEVSRTFDHHAAAVYVVVEDDHHNRSHHTFYLAGDHGVVDVDAEVAQILTEIDTHSAVVRERMIAAGWTP